LRILIRFNKKFQRKVKIKTMKLTCNITHSMVNLHIPYTNIGTKKKKKKKTIHFLLPKEWTDLVTLFRIYIYIYIYLASNKRGQFSKLNERPKE
jgi:hypothetical protein